MCEDNAIVNEMKETIYYQNEIGITKFGLFYKRKQKLNIAINELISDALLIDKERLLIVTYNGNVFIFYVNTLQLSLTARLSGNVIQKCFVDAGLEKIYIQTNNYMYVLNYDIQIVRKIAFENVLFFEEFVAYGDCFLINSKNKVYIYNRIRDTKEICYETDTLIDAKVAICKMNCIVLSFNQIDCFSLGTYDKIWSINLCETQRFRLAPIILGDEVLVACPSGKIVVINYENGVIVKVKRLNHSIRKWHLSNSDIYTYDTDNVCRILCLVKNAGKMKCYIRNCGMQTRTIKNRNSIDNIDVCICEEIKNLIKQAYFSRIKFRVRNFPPSISKFEAIDITSWLEERYNIELGVQFIRCLLKKDTDKMISILYDNLNYVL